MPGLFFDKDSMIVWHDRELIQIGNNVIILPFCTITTWGHPIIIEDNVWVSQGVTISAQKGIKIGKNTMIGEFVSIRDHEHILKDIDIPIIEQGFIQAEVEIGENNWIGAKATILAGVKTGKGVIIGANTVVPKFMEIPDGAIVAGNPGKIIGYVK